MLTRGLFNAVVAAFALIFVQAVGTPPALGQDAALSGQVTSAEEGPMEGEIVSAKKAGSNITVSVISNAQGRYSFPAARLEAGYYKPATGADRFALHAAD